MPRSYHPAAELFVPGGCGVARWHGWPKASGVLNSGRLTPTRLREEGERSRSSEEENDSGTQNCRDKIASGLTGACVSAVSRVSCQVCASHGHVYGRGRPWSHVARVFQIRAWENHNLVYITCLSAPPSRCVCPGAPRRRTDPLCLPCAPARDTITRAHTPRDEFHLFTPK